MSDQTHKESADEQAQSKTWVVIVGTIWDLSLEERTARLHTMVGDTVDLSGLTDAMMQAICTGMQVNPTPAYRVEGEASYDPESYALGRLQVSTIEELSKSASESDLESLARKYRGVFDGLEVSRAISELRDDGSAPEEEYPERPVAVIGSAVAPYQRERAKAHNAKYHAGPHFKLDIAQGAREVASRVAALQVASFGLIRGRAEEFDGSLTDVRVRLLEFAEVLEHEASKQGTSLEEATNPDPPPGTPPEVDFALVEDD